MNGNQFTVTNTKIFDTNVLTNKALKCNKMSNLEEEENQKMLPTNGELRYLW